MERPARVHSYDLPGLEDAHTFGCWGRDCPCKIGELMRLSQLGDETGSDEIWLHSTFVWSRETRLYLVPKNDIWQWKKPESEKHKERGANFRADIDRYEFLVRTEGKPIASRWAAQITGEKFAKNTKRDFQKIKADGRRVRVRCPLCSKVSILSYNTTGATNDSAQREQKLDNGHPKQSLGPP